MTAATDPADVAGATSLVRIAAQATFSAGDTATVNPADALYWFEALTVDLTADAFYDKPAELRFAKTFTGTQHLLTNIAGPLTIIGGVAEQRSLVNAVILPGEKNDRLPQVEFVTSDADGVDVLNVFDDTSGENKVGEITDTRIVGFGMSPDLTIFDPFTGRTQTYQGGITYGELDADGNATVEVLNLFLGQGDDQVTVSGSVGSVAPVDSAIHSGITVLHGGGNTLTNGVRGGDVFTVTGGGGDIAPLVIYGDTSQDALHYSGIPEQTDDQATIGGASRVTLQTPLANPFANFGDDVIDASALALSGAPAIGLTVYGGRGEDRITGSQYGDQLFGGSENDVIAGLGGSDHIYGDSAINVDVILQTMSVVNLDATSPVAANPNLEQAQDPLLLSADQIDAGAGDDIVFGDFGLAAQNLTAPTSLPADYLVDVDDPALKLFTTALDTVHVIQSARQEAAGADEDGRDFIEGGLGSDILLGGVGAGSSVSIGADEIVGDTIFGNVGVTAGLESTQETDGDDVILGDFGEVLLVGGAMAQAQTVADAFGEADDIQTDGGDNVVFGGAGGDRVFAGGDHDGATEDGDNRIFGDGGLLTDLGVDPTDADPALAGAANLTARTLKMIATVADSDAADLIIGGSSSDWIIAGGGGDKVYSAEGEDIVIGDYGSISGRENTANASPNFQRDGGAGADGAGERFRRLRRRHPDPRRRGRSGDRRRRRGCDRRQLRGAGRSAGVDRVDRTGRSRRQCRGSGRR